ncbi:MAG: hypothetical protein ACT4QD_02665 [Acidobacteriota bacterium]
MPLLFRALCCAAVTMSGLPGAAPDAGGGAGAPAPVVTDALGELAQSGSIRGRLDLRRVARPTPRRPTVAESGGAPARDEPDLRRAVVYLDVPASPLPLKRPEGRVALDQRNETFVPHLLAITAGTVVDFPNSDKTFHNVFSLSKAKRFDLGRYAAGQSKSVRFDRPGVVRVFCDIHSHMNAFVLVFAHPHFTVTDVEGGFRLDNIPAGTHTIVAWYEGDVRDSRAITVPPGGSVDVELVVR